MPTHIEQLKRLVCHIEATDDASFVDGKMIHRNLILEKENEIDLGRLRYCGSLCTKYLQKNRLPSWETNCTEDWETKVNAVEETHQKDTFD